VVGPIILAAGLLPEKHNLLLEIEMAVFGDGGLNGDPERLLALSANQSVLPRLLPWRVGR